jgi:methylated-DNA-protein-cysteine methyltransferase related protein
MNTAEKNRAAIYLALAAIPQSSVLSYGQLATRAGLPGAARLVGNILRNLPEATQLPWHRVVNAQGKLSLPLESEGYKEQLRRLQAEGIEVKNGKIALKTFQD